MDNGIVGLTFLNPLQKLCHIDSLWCSSRTQDDTTSFAELPVEPAFGEVPNHWKSLLFFIPACRSHETLSLEAFIPPPKSQSCVARVPTLLQIQGAGLRKRRKTSSSDIDLVKSLLGILSSLSCFVLMHQSQQNLIPLGYNPVASNDFSYNKGCCGEGGGGLRNVCLLSQYLTGPGDFCLRKKKAPWQIMKRRSYCLTLLLSKPSGGLFMG